MAPLAWPGFANSVTRGYWYVLLVYLVFVLVATGLALARRWFRPGAKGEGVWRKYPSFIVINLIFIGVGWLPPAWHAPVALVAVLGALASWEFARALVPDGWLAHWLPVATGVLVALSGWLAPSSLVGLCLACLLVLLLCSALAAPRDASDHRAWTLVGGVIYLPLCLAAYVWVWHGDPSGFRTAFLYLTVATNDALAQITGQLFGRRPLAPRLSPAKTLEGALGGVLLAGAMGAALSPAVGWRYPFGAGLGLVMGLASLAGDLIASAWKRASGLKQYSGVLGAHGGVLDRFDSLIFAAPVFYLLLTPGSLQFLLGLLLSSLIGYAGYRRRSLSASGVFGAILVGTLIFGFGGWAWGTLLVVFFVSASALSHFKESRKAALAEKFSKGSQRDLAQALANGGAGALAALGFGFWPHPLWWAAFAGAMATVNADTWATELGVLSRSAPRLITTGRPVEVGTAGGLTLAGTLAALGGAALIGLVAAAFDLAAGQSLLRAAALVAVAAAAGLLGSLLDSLLGATVQAIYYCDACRKETERHPLHTCGGPTRHLRGLPWLNNDWVNFLSALLGAALAALAWSLIAR